jgi:hypothetical protein
MSGILEPFGSNAGASHFKAKLYSPMSTLGKTDSHNVGTSKCVPNLDDSGTGDQLLLSMLKEPNVPPRHDRQESSFRRVCRTRTDTPIRILAMRLDRFLPILDMIEIVYTTVPDPE